MIILYLIIVYLVLYYIQQQSNEGFENIKYNKKIEFTLKEGECLYIPRNWNYKIISSPKSRSYSFWFNKAFNGDPYIINEHLDTEMANHLIDDLLYKTGYDAVLEQSRGDIMYKRKNQIEKVDSSYPNNRIFIDELYLYLEVPQLALFMKYDNENFDFMYNIEETKYLQSNMDSILCLLQGKQKIVLYR